MTAQTDLKAISDALSAAQSAVAAAQADLVPIAPPQAISAGKMRLSFREDFTSFFAVDGFSYQGDGGNVWTNGMGFYGPNPGPAPIWNGPGLLTLPGGAMLTTQSRGYPAGTDAASRKFLHGYFEATMRATGPSKPPQNWFSFWLFSALHQQVSQAAGTHWAEIDINETAWWPKMGATTHDWEALSAAPWQQEASPQNPAEPAWQNYPGSPTPDLTQWHKYGCLWVPGSIGFYFDDQLVQSTATPEASILDTDP